MSRSVALVGYAWSTLHLIPWEQARRGEIEIWGMNDLYIMPDMHGPFHAWFQMHLERELLARFTENADWMRQDHGFPIFTLENLDWCPNSVKYPIREVLQALGRDYMTNTVSYMLGLVYLNSVAINAHTGKPFSEDGFTDVYLYGIDMATGEEYGSQRPSCEYLIGLLEGKGINVHIPSQSDILKAGRLYGYEAGHTIKDKIVQRKEELSSKLEYQRQRTKESNNAEQQLVGALQDVELWERNWAWDHQNDEWASPVCKKIIEATVIRDGNVYIGGDIERAGDGFAIKKPPTADDDGGGHAPSVDTDGGDRDSGSAHEEGAST